MNEGNYKSNLVEYSVSEISASIKRVVEDTFGYVRVKGEISGFKRAPSGHIYFTLKDENANLSAVCWRGVVERFSFQPEDGLEVVCNGRVTTYAGHSKYQLVVEMMQPSGEGALMALLEKRKSMFKKEGLFDARYKKPLPRFPFVIGVVTSETGAVIRDIIHRIEDRFGLHIILWPVLVQGDKAASQISNAINGFNNLDSKVTPKPDVIIVARGGGSIEDLWAFNEEKVVRAVFDSCIPIISAVGHETDVTLIDFVSDKRAPTPTAAAEMAVCVKLEMRVFLDACAQRLASGLIRKLTYSGQRLQDLIRGLPKPMYLFEERQQSFDVISQRFGKAFEVFYQYKNNYLLQQVLQLRSPKEYVALQEVRLISYSERLDQVFALLMERKKQSYVNLIRLLDSYHYNKVLERGFVLVKDAAGKLVKRKRDIESSQCVEIEFFDGRKRVEVVD